MAFNIIYTVFAGIFFYWICSHGSDAHQGIILGIVPQRQNTGTVGGQALWIQIHGIAAT